MESFDFCVENLLLIYDFGAFCFPFVFIFAANVRQFKVIIFRFVVELTYVKMIGDLEKLQKLSHVLDFEGSNYLRQRLVLSLLSSRPIRISNIRAKDFNPGLQGSINWFYSHGAKIR